jgi:DNA (cytosine-5)-methyltransferase 1
MDFQTNIAPHLFSEEEGCISHEETNVESFAFDFKTQEVIRRVLRRNSEIVESRVPRSSVEKLSSDLGAEFDLAWLQTKHWPGVENAAKVLRVADLFSGCGGLSLGVAEACRALNIAPKFVFASDINEVALNVYRTNLNPEFFSSQPIESFVNGRIGSKPTTQEIGLKDALGSVDFVIAGPPCQGHSDLNNHTRRDDPKNQLILKVVRFAELFKPTHILIENVQGIRHDRSGALLKAKTALTQLGYALSEAVLHADRVGAAQARKRFFLLASRNQVQELGVLNQVLGTSERPIAWAIGDLLNADRPETFESAAKHSAVNQQRVNYLFDHGLYELPNSERPPCHRDKAHSYTGVYGRMRWDRPAPTITTGFGSTGQGRFVHPLQRRTLTPHEAARIQFFPDFFNFGELGRRQYQELIGNAVPSKLAYAIALHQLR